MPALGCNRSYDYSRRDQAFLIDNWLKLDGFDLPGDNNFEEKERGQSENYFDTGLNLDSALNSSRGDSVTKPWYLVERSSAVSEAEKSVSMRTGKRPGCPQSSSDCTRSAPLPRFGFVEKLQRAFNNPDLLKNNPYLNKDAAGQMFKRQKVQKRVRFAKVEISDKHLPNCRRESFSKHEFGHLHSPSCSNYKAEQSLCKQEFLIRGNFIRDNAKQATSECDFYNSPPVRPVEPLSSSLVIPHDMHLDLKTSTLDSITYHDKISPGLRSTPTPVQETERKPPPSVSSVDSFAPNPNYKPMPCQPIFSDDIIISPPSRSKDVAVDNINGNKGLTDNKVQNQLPEPSIPQISVVPAESGSSDVCDLVERCDGLKLVPEVREKSRTASDSGSVDSGISSVDSGYDSKCGDFMDDFLNNMSDDSESESESDDTDSDKTISLSDRTSFGKTSEGATKESESETETVVDGPPSSTSLPTLEFSSSSSESDLEEVDPSVLMEHQHDSGISSLSDNEEDIDDLIRSHPSVRPVRPAPTKPHSWSSGTSDSVQPAAAPAMNKIPVISPTHSFQIREGYVNPFSKRKMESSVGLKQTPSVLGRLICEKGSKDSELVRNPDLAPDRFKFDCPSPDDVVRLRQAGVVSC